MPKHPHENIAPNITIAEQRDMEVPGPVVLLNIFTVREGDQERMLEIWREDAGLMSRQPGYITTQLHQAVGAANVLINYAVFESIESYREAWNQPEFQALLEKSPEGAIARPILLQKVAVPGICVA